MGEQADRHLVQAEAVVAEWERDVDLNHGKIRFPDGREYGVVLVPWSRQRLVELIAAAIESEAESPNSFTGGV